MRAYLTSRYSAALNRTFMGQQGRCSLQLCGSNKYQCRCTFPENLKVVITLSGLWVFTHRNNQWLLTLSVVSSK